MILTSFQPDPFPRAWEMPAGGQLFFICFTSVPLAVLTGIALYRAARHRDPMPLLMLVSGFCCVLYEPMVDILGLCAFPSRGNWSTVSAFGSDVPIFVHLTYTWYVGGQSWVVLNMLRKGATARRLWTVFAIFSVAEFLLELPGLYLKLWAYYGDQPFVVGGFPLWWGPVNALMPMMSGAAIYLLRDFFTGWKLIGVIPLDVMVDGMANASSAWPIWFTLNSGLGPAATSIGGLATIGLSVLTMAIIVHAVRRSEMVVANTVYA